MRCFLSLIFVFSSFVYAKDFSSWRKYSQGELLSETTSLVPGSSGTVGLRLTMVDGWHTYWVNPGDSGAALNLKFKNSRGVRVKAVHHPLPVRTMTGPLISLSYEHEVLFPIDVEVDKSVPIGEPVRIEADVEWLVCEDACIPAVDTFKLLVPTTTLAEVRPGPHFAAFQKARREIPEPATAIVKFEDEADGAKLRFDSAQFVGDFVDFFPFKGSGVTNVKPQVANVAPLVLGFKKNNSSRVNENRVGVLVLLDPQTRSIKAWSIGDSGWNFKEDGAGGASPSLLWMLLSAFLGGVILNLMPCVFPILSMKLLSLLKSSEQNAGEVRRQNFAYVFGVLISFLAVGLLLSSLRSAGQLVGWGFQLQSPVFLAFLCWLFFVLSLNLFGVFEIELFDMTVGHKLTRLGGVWGSFFTGVLAVVVASPCTAPFMGVALGFGLSQPTLILLLIFLSLGLGLALPYLIFAIFPSSVHILPKPGAWMSRVKQVMAVPLALTVLWLLWIVWQVVGRSGVLMVVAGFALLSVLIFVRQERTRRFLKWFSIPIFLVLAISIRGLGERPAAAKILDADWEAFSLARVDQLKGENVFVDMTADWCLTCKVNEALVLNDPDVKALLKKKKVHLLKGDWTQKNEEITRFLAQYQRAGVPFYVVFSKKFPDGTVLPEVLTKSSFMEWFEREIPDEEAL